MKVKEVYMLVISVLFIMVSCENKSISFNIKNSYWETCRKNFMITKAKTINNQLIETATPYFINDNQPTVFIQKSINNTGDLVLISLPEMDVTGDIIGEKTFFFNDGAPYAVEYNLIDSKQVFFFNLEAGTFLKYEDKKTLRKATINYVLQTEIVQLLDIILFRTDGFKNYQSYVCLNNIDNFEFIRDSVPFYQDSCNVSKYSSKIIKEGEKFRYIQSNFHCNNDTFFLIKIECDSYKGWIKYDNNDFLPLSEKD